MSQNAETTNINNSKPHMALTTELAAQAAIRAKQIQRRLSEEQMETNNKIENSQHALDKNLKSSGSGPQLTPGFVHQYQTNKMVPAVPARAYERTPPPEIPPKRYPVKIVKRSDAGAPVLPVTQNRQPPPLPKKPHSAQNSAQNSTHNSPLCTNKFRETPPIPLGKPDLPDVRRSSTGAKSASLEVPEYEAEQTHKADAADATYHRNNLGTSANSTATIAISPSEDFGSADALRGIESGLRNMERAMQEQMSLRSMEAAAAAAALAAQHKNFDLNTTRIFSRPGIYDHHQSLDDSREALMARQAAGTGHGLEELELRGLQLQKHSQQQNIHQYNSNTSSTSVSSSASPTHSVEYPPPLPNIEHHMRSLDRNLPLEVQYSRHRHAQQLPTMTAAHSPQQQNQSHRLHRQAGVGVPSSNQPSAADMLMSTQGTGPMPLSADLREQIRQQLLGVVPPMSVVHNTGKTPGSAAAAALLQHQAQSRAVAAAQVVRNAMLANVHLTREELRMRRRSSHDETVTTGAESFATQPGRL